MRRTQVEIASALVPQERRTPAGKEGPLPSQIPGIHLAHCLQHRAQEHHDQRCVTSTMSSLHMQAEGQFLGQPEGGIQTRFLSFTALAV
jgi:hypothetical protein